MTEYDEAAERLRALAFWFGGRFVDGFEYPIAGTPCEAAIRNQRMVHIPERALALYPQAERIALPDPVSVASYLGIPLVGPDRRVMGHVAVVDVRPMPPDKRALALFEIFANRALAEMRRVRLEDELRARQDKLSRLIDGAMDAIVELDRELRITMVSAEGGYGQDEIAAMEALAPAIVQAFISKRAEERLRRGHEEYRHVVENSGSVILRMDKEMRVTFVNQYGLRFFGYRPEEIIGRRALGTIVPLREETGRDMAAMAEDILRTPERYRQNVHQNLRKDGSLVWMSWTNTPVYDDGGNLVELLSIGNDLSELKKAEAALRRTADQLQESETRYRTLVELAPDAVLVHQDRRILFANAEALRLYGASRLDQLLGRDILELVHPDDRASAAERVERAGRGGRTPVATFMRSFSPGFRELICHTNLGEDVPIEWANVRLREDVSISIGVDVRERQRAEEALRASEERYRTLFENMNEGFYLAEVICDASGKPTDFRYLEANAAFESLTGLSRKRVVGKTAREVLPGIEEGWVETYGASRAHRRAGSARAVASAPGALLFDPRLLAASAPVCVRVPGRDGTGEGGSRARQAAGRGRVTAFLAGRRHRQPPGRDRHRRSSVRSADQDQRANPSHLAPGLHGGRGHRRIREVRRLPSIQTDGPTRPRTGSSCGRFAAR